MSGWTIVWIVLLSLLGLLVLLLAVPIYLRVTFHGELTVLVRVWGIPFRLYPRKKKPEKEKPPKAEKPKKSRKQKPGKLRKESMSVSQMLKEDGVGAVVSYYTSLARLLSTEARRLLRAITVDHLDIRLVVASGDAAETAQNYGRVCALIFPAEALVESEIRVRRRKVRVMPDFLASKGEADLDIRLHAVPARITWSFFRLLFSFIFHQNTPAGSNVKEAGSNG